MSCHLIVGRRSAGRVTLAALFAAAFVILVSARSEATPLDKLSGKSLTVGNLVFSDFSWPFFSGAGPSNIDVQGIVVTDPLTGRQQAGLRFVVIQSGAPKPFLLSAQGGPHEVLFQIDYTVTDFGGQLATLQHSINTAVSGQAGYLFSTNASDSLAITEGSLAAPTLTMMNSCTWFGTVCSGSAAASANSYAIVAGGDLTQTGPLFPGVATYYVQHSIQLAISNRKGVPAGTVTLQGWDALFNE